MAIEKIYLDRRFTVNGKQSHIRLDNFVELGLLPTGGLPCQIIIKNSNGYWDYDWGYWDDLVIANNALTYDNSTCPNLLQWGGPLVKNTIVNGLGIYFLRMTNFSDLSLSAQNTTTLNSQNGPLTVGSPILNIDVLNQFNLITPNVNATTALTGSILQLIDGNSGESEWTPFTFPLTDGLLNQVLVTDGAGTVTWQNVPATLVGADNGLNVTGADVYLGGTLLQNTTILGNSNAYSLNILDLNIFDITSDIFNLSTLSNVIISAPSAFELLTPNVNSSTALQGSILQLQNATSGDSEYTSYQLPLSNPNVNDILVATSTNSTDWQAQEKTISINFIDGDVELSTVVGTRGGTVNIPITPQLNGYILQSVSLSSTDATGAAVSVGFRVDLVSGGVTGLINGVFSGGVSNYTPGTFPSASTNDYVAISLNAGSGANIFGLTATLDFTSS